MPTLVRYLLPFGKELSGINPPFVVPNPTVATPTLGTIVKLLVKNVAAACFIWNPP